MPNNKAKNTLTLNNRGWSAVTAYLRANPDVKSKAELREGLRASLGTQICGDALLTLIVMHRGNEHQRLLVDLT